QCEGVEIPAQHGLAANAVGVAGTPDIVKPLGSSRRNHLLPRGDVVPTKAPAGSGGDVAALKSPPGSRQRRHRWGAAGALLDAQPAKTALFAGVNDTRSP